MASENGIHFTDLDASSSMAEDGLLEIVEVDDGSVLTTHSDLADTRNDSHLVDNQSHIEVACPELGTGPNPTTQERQRAELEARLRETINSLFTIGLSVYDFQPGSDALLRQRVNGLVTQYKELMELGSSLDMMIPEEVIRYVEDGRNPDLFSREFTERAVAENQFAHGRMKAFECFKQQLEEELSKVMPSDVVQSYQKQMNSS